MKLTQKQALRKITGELENSELAFISAWNVQSTIKTERRGQHLTIKGLSRAIRDGLEDRAELEALIKELNKYI